MAFKFEQLEIWSVSLDFVDRTYELVGLLPDEERFNLVSQMRRAATSVSLNIAEGSTGQTDAEQARFLGIALRSLIETVGCLHLVRRRGYPVNVEQLRQIYREAEVLAAKIQAMRRSIQPNKPWVREDAVFYEAQGPLSEERRPADEV